MTKLISIDAVDQLKNDGFLLVPLTAAARDKVLATLGAAYPFFRASAKEKDLNKLPDDFGYRPIGVKYSRTRLHVFETHLERAGHPTAHMIT